MWEFKVPQAVPLQGMISYEDLAAKCVELNNGLEVPMLNLRRMVRHAIQNRVFCEPKKGFVAHSRASQLMLEDELMNNWVGFMCNDLWLPIANVVSAMKQWPGSEESNETGVNLAYKQSQNWFDWLQTDDVVAKRYNLAMQAHSGGEGYSAKATADGYPWDELLPKDGIVVDMGGNQGYVSFAIAEAHPSLHFVVQDTPGMRTPETIGAVPEHLQQRVELTTHDFFTPQTVVADAYFFRMIFHGFSDKYCIQILRALIPALRPGARVIVNDGALPEPGEVSSIEEQTMRTLDLFMQVTVNAREREPEDWRDLFRRADERFKFNRIWKPTKSRFWFIDVEWTG